MWWFPYTEDRGRVQNEVSAKRDQVILDIKGVVVLTLDPLVARALAADLNKAAEFASAWSGNRDEK